MKKIFLCMTAIMLSLLSFAQNDNLPITLTSFTGTDVGHGVVQFKWTVTMEQNVDHYEVWNLNNGGEYRILSVNSQGDTNTPRTYVTAYQAVDVIESKIPIIVGFILLSTVLMMSRRKKPRLFLGVCLGLILLSCHKTNNPPPSSTITKYYRLKEVDIDGNINSFPIIQVKINQ